MEQIGSDTNSLITVSNLFSQVTVTNLQIKKFATLTNFIINIIIYDNFKGVALML